MKIVVTGGAGFIGGNFVHHMVNKYPDYEIVNLDLLTYAGNLETLKPVENRPNYRFDSSGTGLYMAGYGDARIPCGGHELCKDRGDAPAP